MQSELGSRASRKEQGWQGRFGAGQTLMVLDASFVWRTGQPVVRNPIYSPTLCLQHSETDLGSNISFSTYYLHDLGQVTLTSISSIENR
jgi:hypothetical protein